MFESRDHRSGTTHVMSLRGTWTRLNTIKLSPSAFFVLGPIRHVIHLVIWISALDHCR